MAERLKLQWEKADDEDLLDMLPLGDEKGKQLNRINNFNSEQAINQTFNIISTNRSWKQFVQVKKWNQTNTISFVSA